jgi:VCPO second helical-bundle domain
MKKRAITPARAGRTMKHVRLGRLAVLGTAVALVAPTVAQANEVTKWNEIAVATVNAQAPIASAPPAGSIFVAMVQGAVYGAVNAVDRHGKPYLLKRSFPKASVDAAAATAAFRVLTSLFGANATLVTAYNESLDPIPDGTSKDQGKAVGEMAAAAMLAEGHDGRTVIGCTFGSGLPGVWQPLANPMGMPICDPSAWVGNAKPFVAKSASQFRTAGPLPLGSAAYAAQFDEVKAIGSLNSLTRLPGETHAAAFWQTNPAANFNAIARRFAVQLSLSMSDSARLFAMLDLSAADALINTWNDKYYWNFWRPITAIRHPDDGNAATDTDATWTPLFSAGFPTSPPLPADPLPEGGIGGPLSTPPYPEHPSGATAYASASMHALASFFGTDAMTFYATSGRFPGEQRTFNRFSDLTNEVLEARIWAGIHFRAADDQAANLGREVEQYVHTHQFAFVH